MNKNDFNSLKITWLSYITNLGFSVSLQLFNSVTPFGKWNSAQLNIRIQT